MIYDEIPSDSKNDPVLHKRRTGLVDIKKDVKVTFEAHRLKGKVKNLGIKNLGHQKKKSKA